MEKQLIEVLITPILQGYKWDNKEGLRDILQWELDLHFKFFTIVSDIEVIDEEKRILRFNINYGSVEGDKKSLGVELVCSDVYSKINNIIWIRN